jgi:hypothetical protein
MKNNLDRIISIGTLVALVVAIGLLLRKTAPVAQAPSAQAISSTNHQSINAREGPEQSTAQPEDRPTSAIQAPQAQPATSGGSAAAPSSQNPFAGLSQSASATSSGKSDDISSAISGVLSASAGAEAGLNPDSEVGTGTPNIKDQKVTYEGDMVHGQFLTEVAGKDVWITISGHIGQKDGYATFDPTEFKVGNMNVPVSLVNPLLQRKMLEERDRLKLSEPGSSQ